MNVDYENLEASILDGSFRAELETELTIGFRAMRMSGDPLPLATYYAAQMAEIVGKAAPEPMRPELAYQVYLDILAATEGARSTVMAEA